jgi:major membrane immunogen (membrane-anchored lipoprotein)
MNRLMKSASKLWQPFAIASSLVGLVVVMGCGDDGSGLGARYKVTGKVTYKGAPLEHGTINFLPTKPAPPEGRAATSPIKDGAYALSTAGGEDGALAGDYMIAIVAVDVDMASAASSKAEGGRIHEGDAKYKKAMKDAKALIPVKYNAGETSGLKATVTTKPQTLDFQLTD